MSNNPLPRPRFTIRLVDRPDSVAAHVDVALSLSHPLLFLPILSLPLFLLFFLLFLVYFFLSAALSFFFLVTRGYFAREQCKLIALLSPGNNGDV